MAEEDARRARVERLLDAARALPSDPALSQRLLQTTGLSPENVAHGLQRGLELHPEPAHVASLLASTPEAPAAHVLLSSNVFVAALRAIALGVASSANVRVRASRRDPALAEALHARVPELFELVTKLAPAPGDHLWSYGSDQTLREVRDSLPRGVWFHAHGSGFGAVVVKAASFGEAEARAVALDTALFDQRGCLSPRVVVVLGDAESARAVARRLAAALEAIDGELPLGAETQEERAEARRSRDAAAYAFELFAAGSGWVSFARQMFVPPARRNLHVTHTDRAPEVLSPFAEHLTSVSSNDERLRAELSAALPGARVVGLGEMQRPPLDGPVDLRRGTSGELI